MILSQPDLRRAVARGAIAFKPGLEDDQWGQASVDLRLGFSFTRLKQLPGVTLSVADGLPGIAAAGFWNTAVLENKDAFGNTPSFDLESGGFVLAMTLESITVPPNMIALVEGRSTYARVGLSMHQTAPWIQPGWSGPIVLEIMNNGPLTIRLTPILDRPCQISFFQLTSALPPEMRYGSRASEFYADQSHPLRHEQQLARAAKKTSAKAAPLKEKSRPVGGARARQRRPRPRR